MNALGPDMPAEEVRTPRPVIELAEIVKTYGAVHAVDGVSLTIQAEEFITLLGPSGSGKTTTLMLLAGFERLTSGDIRIGGVSMRDVPPNRRNIGVVFQSYALFPHMTVFENVAFPLRARGVPASEIRDRAARYLDAVKLSPYVDRVPSQLSGGQQQRVALARALVFNPSFILMDEPLSALDRQLREFMQIEIKRLQRELRFTAVYVTHDQQEALAMSDRIAVMNHGRIEQIDTPARLYKEPRTAFVSGFVGDCNRLDGFRLLDVQTGLLEGSQGVRLIGRPMEPLAAGDAAVLMVRPEDITIEPMSAGQPNLLEGRIAELIFAGDLLRVHVVDASGQSLWLKAYGSSHPVSLSIGNPIFFSIDPARCLVFRASGAEG